MIIRRLDFGCAWTLRGMNTLMMDFILNPDFVHKLLTEIVDYNIAHVQKATEYDLDAVYFGDDWGTQNGLQMGPDIWYEFIYPQLRRIYKVVKDAGLYVMIHSCGKVDALFDALVGIGLDCFNPFQPEVMDTLLIIEKFHDRLAFHGGLSTQKTLPYGLIDDVKRETELLLDTGKNGGLVFAPGHAVEVDVSLENMLSFIELLRSQPGFKSL